MTLHKQLKEGIDFYFNEKNQMVFTAHYHQQRGYCCQSGCLHCPFNFLEKNADPSIPSELNDPWEKCEMSDWEEEEK